MDSPYGYWYEALEIVARTMLRDDYTRMTNTKAIRKAALLPDEAVTAYITQGDDDGVTLLLLTDRCRFVRIRFEGDEARFVAVPASDIRFLGGEISGTTSQMTEVQGFATVAYRFVLHTPPEATVLSLPTAAPNSLLGNEEIAFAQQLLAAIHGATL